MLDRPQYDGTVQDTIDVYINPWPFLPLIPNAISR